MLAWSESCLLTTLCQPIQSQALQTMLLWDPPWLQRFLKGEVLSIREAKMLMRPNWKEAALILLLFGFVLVWLLFRRVTKDGQVAFHSSLNTVLNLTHVNTEQVSVGSLPWEISKSNRLLISPHLFSVTVENWLSRGGLRQRRLIIGRRRSHALLEQVLPEFPPVLWREHQHFTFILMCTIWKMLFQLWS